MSNRVAQFLIDLSKDPGAMAAFARDPGLLLSGAGLTEAEEETVRSADMETIYRSLLGGEDADRLPLIASMGGPFPPPPKPQDPPGKPPGPPPGDPPSGPPKGQVGVF